MKPFILLFILIFLAGCGDKQTEKIVEQNGEIVIDDQLQEISTTNYIENFDIDTDTDYLVYNDDTEDVQLRFDSGDYEIVDIEEEQFYFEITYNATNKVVDVYLGQGVTLTEAAKMFLEELKKVAKEGE